MVCLGNADFNPDERFDKFRLNQIYKTLKRPPSELHYTHDTTKMAKFQILHPYPEWPIQCTVTLLVSIKSLSNADSDAVESLKNSVWIKTCETLGISLYIFLFSSSNTWPYPFVSTFNQLPIGLQVLNLVQSFFTNIYRTHFLDFWIFSPFLDVSKINRT